MGRDPIKQPHKLQAITKARVPKPLERALQVILLSIFSFLLSNYSSWLHNINLSSTKAFRSNLDYFIDRKAIFLFFNAILLILVKDSGLLSHRSSLSLRIRLVEILLPHLSSEKWLLVVQWETLIVENLVLWLVVAPVVKFCHSLCRIYMLPRKLRFVIFIHYIDNCYILSCNL